MNSTSPTTDLQRSQPVSDQASLRNSVNLPNLITLSRLGFALILFLLIYIEGFWITATVVFVIAAATDALDGFVARRYGLVTTLGRILDPFVDKIIVCGVFVFLLERKLDSGINSWMVLIVIAREMFVTSLRGFLERQGQDFSATWSGKLKMILQCAALTVSLLSLSPVFAHRSLGDVAGIDLSFKLGRDVLLWTAVAVTAISGFVYSWRAYHMITLPRQQTPGNSSKE